MNWEGVRLMLWLLIGLIVGVPGGWYLHARYGAKVRTVVDEAI